MQAKKLNSSLKVGESCLLECNKPTEDAFWTVVQKILSFEEPTSKWSQLRKASRKQLRKTKEAKIDIESLSLFEQSSIFAQIFQNGNSALDKSDNQLPDCQNRTSTNRLLSTILALEDLRRHQSIAFDSWAKSLPDTSMPETAQVMDLARSYELNQAERLYVESLAFSAPDWCRLLEPALWQDDSRVIFIRAFIEKLLAESPKTTVDSYLPLFWALLEEHRHRHDLTGQFLPDLLLLVEGQTESILLPHFADLLDFPFNKNGIKTIACGGAKQVCRNYLTLKELCRIPIVAILDADVSELRGIIVDSLRPEDRLITLTAGEIEDTFSMPVLIRLIEHHFTSIGLQGPVSQSLFVKECERTAVLDKLWKERGMQGFDKVGFARSVVEILKTEEVPEDGQTIIRTIKEVSSIGCLRF